jgi:hypothetical protein
MLECVEVDRRMTETRTASFSAMKLQGRIELEAQEQLLMAVLMDKFPVQLGGRHGAAQGWGRALAVNLQAHPDAIKLRSELGNRLAAESVRLGLVSMGVVAYCEVRSQPSAQSDASCPVVVGVLTKSVSSHQEMQSSRSMT